MITTTTKKLRRRTSEQLKKLALVDDHPAFRHGLADLLKAYGGFEISFEASNGVEALDKLKSCQPDAILLDTEMPLLNGIDTIDMIRRIYPGMKILMLANQDNEELVVQLMRKGCNGCLLKEYGIDIIVEGLYAVFRNNYFFRGQFSKGLLKKITQSKMQAPTAKKDVLTTREIEIIQLVCQEYSNREISEKLFISVRTVERHRENIQSKIGVRNTVGMVIYAVKNNLIK